MPEEHSESNVGERDNSDDGSVGEACDRRTAMSSGTSLLMAGGLLGGYGTFFTMAGRFFFPSGTNKAWMFVSAVTDISPGASVPFESPTGVRVMITRREDATTESLTEESFLALSSVCPHLGCRVHWEAHNDRFFCPCHNGVFDASGKATEGPPAKDGQDLPRYPLQVVDGALYIEMPYKSV